MSAWERFVDRQIAFHEGGAGKLEDKELGGNTKVYSTFLEEDLAQKERQEMKWIQNREER